MRFWALALLVGRLAFGKSTVSDNATAFVGQPERNVARLFGVLPILDIGTNYILGQSMSVNNASAGFFVTAAAVDGPIQCGPGQECKDGSCCNSLQKCGFQQIHCKGDPLQAVTCISNCDAKAMCGVDSKDGKATCGLNLCCSYYGWCGTEQIHCGDKDQEGHDTPCQKGYGLCEVIPPPHCDPNGGSASGGRKIGYYQSWNTRNRACNVIWPAQLNTTGLTHVNFAFASIDPRTHRLVPAHPEDVALYRDFTALQSKGVKTWIAVGGWDMSDPGTPTHTAWSDMASSPENRKAFVESAVSFMEQHGFQGLDLDWEYPVDDKRGGGEDDTRNQIDLVVDLRKAFGNRFGLSSILAPDFWYLRHMDPKAMEAQVDWFNFMAYDLHGAWDGDNPNLGAKIRPQTDLREIEKDLLPLWFNGVDPKKVNLGMAYYGRGYQAKDKTCLQMDCEFVGTSEGGECTKYGGFMSNFEIQRLIKQKGLQPEMMKDAAVKQITWDDNWIGYDDHETYALKIQKANERCLGGTFIWAIDFDSGKGSTGGGSNPSRPNNNNYDVLIPPNIWNTQNPTVQCIPPCTLVLPPYTLEDMTTISWPPLTTELQTISGGETSTTTIEVPVTEGGVVTKTTYVLITVRGGTTGTVTTTIDVPPFTTNMIEFWPISVEASDTGSAPFVMVPRVFPPSQVISLNGCLDTLPPSLYPGFAPSTTMKYFGYCIAGPHTEMIQPMPTVEVSLPTSRGDCTQWWCDPIPTTTQTCDDFQCVTSSITATGYFFPSTVTYRSGQPEATCTIGCGLKYCELFGCPCGPLGMPFGPGCTGGDIEDHSNSESDDGSATDGDVENSDNSDSDHSSQDENESDSDDSHGDDSDDSGSSDSDDDDKGSKCKPKDCKAECAAWMLGARLVAKIPIPCPCKPKTCNEGSDSGSDTDDSSDSDDSHFGYGTCGKYGCVGGCHGGGCGGGCGLKGCGGCDKPDGCAACPPKQCIPGCKTRCQAPLPTPGGPTSKPSCDEEDKQTITNYWVSCTKYNVTTVSPPSTTSECSTTFSRTLSGCGLTATTTTTTKGDDGPACTRAPLSLDDDEGNNNPDDHNSETSQPHKPTTQPPPTSTPGPGACGGQDGCGCCYDWYNKCAYGCKGRLECRDKCLSDLCFSNDTPDKCHVNNQCAALSCPSKGGDPPKFIESDYMFYLHQVLKPHHGNVWSNKMWYQVGIPLPLGEHPTSIKLCGTGTPDDMAEINAPNMPYGVVVDHPSGSGGSGKEYVDMTFTLGVLFDGGSCELSWTLGQSAARGKNPEKHMCGGANETWYGCGDPKGVGWNSTSDGGFERRIVCYYHPLYRPTQKKSDQPTNPSVILIGDAVPGWLE